VPALIALAGLAILVGTFSSGTASAANQDVMDRCNKALKINGVPQAFSYLSDAAGPQASTCDFTESSFTTFDGPTTRVSGPFPNCAPNTTKNRSVSVTWQSAVGQIDGRYRFTETSRGGVAGALAQAWSHHSGTLGLSTKSITVGEVKTFELPKGQRLYVDFTPKLQSMKGVWHAHIDRTTSPRGPLTSMERFAPNGWDGEAADEVTGPHMLTGGVVDGTVTPVYQPC
jgi:hypothetical protein